MKKDNDFSFTKGRGKCKECKWWFKDTKGEGFCGNNETDIAGNTDGNTSCWAWEKK